jgi:tetratricopeptide (TPR) repeat protein
LYNSLAVAHYRTGNEEQSISCFKKAMEMDPDSIYIKENYINFLSRLHRHQESLDVWMSMRGNSNAPEDLEFKIGNFCQRMGDPDSAIEAYTNQLEKTPDDVKLHNQIGDLYKKQGNPEEAIKQYNQIPEDNEEEYCRSRISLAEIYRKQENFDEAIKAYESVPDCDVRLLMRDSKSQGIEVDEENGEIIIDLLQLITQSVTKHRAWSIAQVGLGDLYRTKKNDPTKALHHFRQVPEGDSLYGKAQEFIEEIKTNTL